MRSIIVCAAVALAAVAQAATSQQEPSSPVADTVAVSSGLSDLDAMTFGCPKAALNAAARRAANVPSQGTYQFAYFKIITDSHHASYEVHFKSNYEGELDLKYCVAMYCQQGFDPKTTKTEVTLMSSGRQPMAGAAHGGSCGVPPTPVRRRSTR